MSARGRAPRTSCALGGNTFGKASQINSNPTETNVNCPRRTESVLNGARELVICVRIRHRGGTRFQSHAPLKRLPCGLVSGGQDYWNFACLFIGNCRSKSKLSSSTFTRDSPRNPSCLPAVCFETRARSCSRVVPRAFATRGN